MGQIILVRAGTTDFDEQHRIVGTLDIPVNVRGQAEMAEMARELKDLKVDRIYSAAGESARESAAALGEQLGVKSRVLDDLRNLDFGLWQGLKVEEVRHRHRKVFRQWEESPCVVCPPAGEMVDQVFERVRKALKPVVKRAQSGRTVLVAPDPLRQVIRCYLKGMDIANLWENGSDGGGRTNGPAWESIEIS